LRRPRAHRTSPLSSIFEGTPLNCWTKRVVEWWAYWDEVYIYRRKQNMIAIVAVRLNVILGRQYLFSPQMEPSIFIFWENMTDCRKNYPFSTVFKLCFKEMFAKGKNGWGNLL
jgi:hypothetical protein